MTRSVRTPPRKSLGLALALVAAGASTAALAQPATPPAPAAAPTPAPMLKPYRVEFPKMEVEGTYKQAMGRYVELPAGFKSPTGFHAGEEMVYIISGDYTVTLQGQPPHTYGPGDSLGIPRGIRHGFSTVSGAKYVAFWVVDKGLPLDLSPEKP